MQSMITYTGFGYDSFNLLLEFLEPKFHTLSPYSANDTIKRTMVGKGRHRKITTIQCLGLVLAWSRSRGKFFIVIVIVLN
jgi:hypothetical protein